MDLSSDARLTAGILILALVAIETGGVYMLSLVRGKVPATPFQISFARAGHAHAAVLVTLSLVIQLYADAAGLGGPLAIVARDGIPTAAILMPAGFFFASMGAGRTKPTRAIWLVYAGAISLAAGAIALGAGLLLG